MLPKWHFLTALISSVFLFPFIQFKILIFIAAAVLIDIDHYFLYVYLKKDFSLKKAYSFFMEKRRIFLKTGKFNKRESLCIFHTIEFLIFLAVLIPLNSFFQIAMLGYSLHMIQDITAQIVTKTLYTRNFSIVGYIYEQRKFNKKQRK